MLNTLENLFKLARERKNNPVDGSYTNKLLNNRSLSKEKILEEINELIEAVEKNTNTVTSIYRLHIYFKVHSKFAYKDTFSPK